MPPEDRWFENPDKAYPLETNPHQRSPPTVRLPPKIENPRLPGSSSNGSFLIDVCRDLLNNRHVISPSPEGRRHFLHLAPSCHAPFCHVSSWA